MKLTFKSSLNETFMRNNLILIAFVALLASCSKTPTDHLTVIAFGSCSKEDSVQLWEPVLAQKPQLWIWLGDNIYGDTNDPMILRKKYDKQKSDPGYQKLIATCPIIGTWDDHDYGKNDAGKDYPLKEESKAEMLRFLDVPAGDAVRTHEGVYSAHTYGSGDRQVKVILLDMRSFRDSLYRSAIKGHRYDPNPDGDMLGEAQWEWLEAQLKNSTAAIHIIGSSVQFISDDHWYEKWGNLPKAKQRMIDLLVKCKPKGLLFISGDRHIAEISRMEIPGLPPVVDFTSSGLTHTWGSDMYEEANQYRVGKMVIAKNFGIIRIDWSGQTPVLTLEIRGRDPQPLDTPVVVQ